MRAAATQMAGGVVLLLLAICHAPGLASAQFSDVLAIKFNGSSESVEAHRLDGASRYKSFNLQVPTAFKDAAHSSFQHLVNGKTGDLFAVKYNGASGFTEVHVLPASSKYLKYSLQTATALEPSSPGTFEFALGPNDDIYAIKFNGSSGFVEVHVLDARKNYQAYSKQVATSLKAVSPLDWQFTVDASTGDLVGVKFNGASDSTELHTLSADSDYADYILQTATALEPTTRTTWRFLLSADGDLVGVKYNGSSEQTEVHVVSKSSSFKSFSLQQATVLEPSSVATFQFGLRGPGLGLVAIKHLGASNSTEIHQLAANLKSYVLQTKTALPVTPNPYSLFQFATNSKGDLYGIKYFGESGATEIHGLSAASKYTQFTVQTATVLPPSSAGSFVFFVDDKADLWALKYEGASNSTELHILTAASGYKKFRLQTKTVLPVTSPSTWALGINPGNGDIYGIKYDGASKSTEVHVVSSATAYKSYGFQQATALEVTKPGEWDFAVDSATSGLATVYGFKYNGASGTSEVHVLSAVSQYKQFALQTATALPPSSPDTFQLLLVPGSA